MKKPEVKRVFAIIGLIFFAGVFISLIIQLIRGAALGVILAHLFCLMIIPCIIYGISILIKHTDKKE